MNYEVKMIRGVRLKGDPVSGDPRMSSWSLHYPSNPHTLLHGLPQSVLMSFGFATCSILKNKKDKKSYYK